MSCSKIAIRLFTGNFYRLWYNKSSVLWMAKSWSYFSSSTSMTRIKFLYSKWGGMVSQCISHLDIKVMPYATSFPKYTLSLGRIISMKTGMNQSWRLSKIVD